MELNKKKNHELRKELNNQKEELNFIRSCMDNLEKGQNNIEIMLQGNNNELQGIEVQYII